MAIEEKKFLGTAGVERLITNIREEISAGDSSTLESAKKYADDLGVNYDAAGTAVTKVQELADGAVAANTTDIAKLNGDASTEGSVAKAVADAKSELNTAIQAVDGKAVQNANDIDALEGRMDTAEGAIDAFEEDVGNVDDLSTTNKTVTGAINEVLTAVSTGGAAAVVAVTAKGATGEYANVYEVTQGGTVVGTINIPKDMVVESGSVVTLTEGEVKGQTAGTYIKLVLQNVTEPLYINAASLVDIYVAKADATQVQLNINSDTREISASIVAGSITATELASNSVITAKIADGNVAKAKLSTEVQASLDKADVAETNAKSHADSLNTAMGNRVKELEDALADGGSIDADIAAAQAAAEATAAADATVKADKALEDAKSYTNDQIGAIDLSGIATNAADIDKLEASMAEGGATANAIADAKKAGTDAQAAVGALEAGAVSTLRTDVDNLMSVSYVEIAADEIDAMFQG